MSSEYDDSLASTITLDGGDDNDDYNEEIGDTDQNVGIQLDEPVQVNFFGRWISYVRGTDIMMSTNRGSGDHQLLGEENFDDDIEDAV